MTTWTVPPVAVARQAREVEGLGHHPLAGEGGVPVDQQRQDRDSRRPGRPWRSGVPSVGGASRSCLARAIPSTTGSTASRCEGLEASVTGRSLPERPVNLPDRPLVVLDVAGPLHRLGVEVALELLEDLPVGLADDVGQHVEPAPVGHAHHRLGRAGHGRLVQQGVEQDDGRLGPLEAEALLADVAGVQEPLEDLGRVQPVEDVALLVGRRPRSGPPRRAAGSTASARGPGCACTRCPASGSRRRAAGGGSRPSVATSRPARPSATNRRGRSQMVRP